MRRLRRTLLAGAVVAALCPGAGAAQGGVYLAVTGAVTSAATGGPVPGLTLFLIHPVLGRTPPAVTDAHGGYSFGGIPSFPLADPKATSFYLEVYWGQQLVGRYRLALSMDLAGGVRYAPDAYGNMVLMSPVGQVVLGTPALRTGFLGGFTIQVEPVVLR